MFNPLSLLIYGRTHPFRNPSFSSTIHSKFLTVLAFFSLFCIVFKVRCSQASLYIIPRARFSVNTFFEVFFTFFAFFLKTLIFQRVQVCSICAFLSSAPDFFVIVRPLCRFPPHFICYFYSIPALSCSPSSLTFVEFFRHFCNFPSKPIDFLPIFGIYSIRIICSNTVVIRRRSLVSA